jgi:predicted  nucleic acid-binding Zn-ribbon protein
MVFDAIKEQRNDHDNAVKESRDEQKRIDKTISDHKLHAAETFATKADVQSGFREIMLKLDNMSIKFDSFTEKVEEKLARKVDK